MATEKKKPESFGKRNALLDIEFEAQRKWEDERLFQVDAPQADSTEDEQEKYFATFPYPYMNGCLHLGHTFCISKAEFAVGYQRLKGKKCLFPFGFHCTGMPIPACADKLKREMDEYGYPPNFQTAADEASTGTESQPADDVVEPQYTEEPKKYVKKPKSKVQAKSGVCKFQWEIMRSLGLSDEEIKKFVDAKHWLRYFPPVAKSDLKSMGIKVDWRRSFITTDENPYYDTFVKWHFLRLKDRGKLEYGDRYTIYSPRDGQPCMDHDRASGEGVDGQEYTLIKMKVQEPLPEKLAFAGQKPVFLVAATLRPETMYGQTNCWMHPNIKYVAFENADGEIFVSTHRAGRNMAYQKILSREAAEFGKLDILAEIEGKDLLGVKLSAPRTKYGTVYTLPMMTIKENKGTGVVTSVPSDSPDDYAALRDLKRKEGLRQKFGITEEMVDFEPIPIIDIPGFGELAAKTACEMFKVNSQNDTKQLAEAKEKTYQKGFYEGVMVTGECKGMKVQDAKEILKKSLVKENQALVYYEPERLVVSRSGEECVVAKCDQWVLQYGDEQWKQQARDVLAQLETYSEETRHNFVKTLDWLHDHACARIYGMGTRLPWDETAIIESLSDSTIYMAYYTVAHFLQSVVDGSKPGLGDIRPEQMTPEVWDHIFYEDKPAPQDCTIPVDTLQKMRNEFRYFYPLDLRVSGKDLVPNHLTYFMYNHGAIWPEQPDRWPKSVRANGHLLLNSEKMAKSTGNFLTLHEAVERFSADGMRFALADAGDGIEDANFVEETADNGILRLHAQIEWTKEVLANINSLRTGAADLFMDQVFETAINNSIQLTDESYRKMLYREALKYGFFELQSARDQYRDMAAASGDKGMHRDLILRFIEVQCLLLAPFCPHVCEHIWELLGKEGSIMHARWPVAGQIDDLKLAETQYLQSVLHDFRTRIEGAISTKAKKDKSGHVAGMKYTIGATIYISNEYLPWQQDILKYLKEVYTEGNGKFPENKTMYGQLTNIDGMSKYAKKVMPFVEYMKDQTAKHGVSALNLSTEFDEEKLLAMNMPYLKKALEVEEVHVLPSSQADGKVQDNCYPGQPFSSFAIEEKPHVVVTFVSRQSTGADTKPLSLPLFNGDTIMAVSRRIIKQDSSLSQYAQHITLWKSSDSTAAAGTEQPDGAQTAVPSKGVFSIDDSSNTALCQETLSDGNLGEAIPIGTRMFYST
ncbi:leucine--tRNA ligase, cytoplasmic-like [Sycon ciliatum]|uniref:leucine--tRNA ligase, cytoplasmic-like n=1 Tax=Sycon ciliatum TaxID=27933 RepID=UPI0020AAAB8C|eukprot:scpid18560/ scgid9362/ Leucine--tRNA ligase, cytoplasmic; Leucyl-tRNA synthetase